MTFYDAIKLIIEKDISYVIVGNIRSEFNSSFWYAFFAGRVHQSGYLFPHLCVTDGEL
jgi:hypothetical protein